MKITRATLPKSVLIAGDTRSMWMEKEHGVSMWLEGPLLFIERRGVLFCTSDFNAWGDAEPKLRGKKAPAEAT